MKIGLVGLGQIAEEHIEGIKANSDLELKAVCDIKPFDDLSEKIKSQIGLVDYFTDYNEMLTTANLDTIAIATPNYLHVQQAIDALNAGKHVLVEKPMATNLEDAQKMIDTVKHAKKVLVVSYHYQFRLEVQYFLNNIKEYGKITGFDIRFSDGVPTDRPWFYDKSKSGGGPWIDSGVNVVSILRLLIPDSLWNIKEAKFEYEQRDIIKDKDVEDYAEVILGFNNSIGKVVVDWRNLSGEKSKLYLLSKFKTNKGEVVLDHIAHTLKFDKKIFEGADKRYIGIYQDFVRRVHQEKSNAFEAMQDLKLIMDVYSIK